MVATETRFLVAQFRTNLRQLDNFRKNDNWTTFDETTSGQLLMKRQLDIYKADISELPLPPSPLSPSTLSLPLSPHTPSIFSLIPSIPLMSLPVIYQYDASEVQEGKATKDRSNSTAILLHYVNITSKLEH